MREFKFRAWHEYGSSATDLMMPGMINDVKPGDCLHWKNQGEKIVSVMQSTGLKDKNGNEIYEGDIVTGDTTWDYDREVTIHFKGEVVWDDSDTGFFYFTESDEYPYVKTYHAENVEVVGNIYESETIKDK